MNYSDILKYLQGLLTNKQTMQGQEYQSNLGLQQQELGQQNQQFQGTLGLQTQAEKDAAAQALAAQALAQQQFNLQKQSTVIPGSATWFAMQNYLNNPKPTTQQPTPGVTDGGMLRIPGAAGWTSVPSNIPSQDVQDFAGAFNAY